VIGLIIAALKWDPTVRGILFPAIMFLILCGSSYLIMATNVGNRLSFLLANAAFWGWMALMCIIWLIYGIGLKGKSPAWNSREAIVNVNDAQFAKMKVLPAEPGKKVKGWTEVKEGTPTRGEASARVDAYLKAKTAEGGAQLVPEKGDATYVAVAAYETGGEQIFKIRPRLKANVPEIKDDKGKVIQKAVTHPWYFPTSYRFMGLLHGERHYVQINRFYNLDENGGVIKDAKEKPSIDLKKKPFYVHAVRNQGKLRQPAWFILFASLLLFGISCLSLHRRDRQVMAVMKLNPARAIGA
jgi:hypothetical protein